MKTMIEKIGKHVIMIIFAIIALYLVTMNVISTCYADRNEHAYYVFDSVLPVLIAEVSLFVLYYIHKKKNIWFQREFNLKRFLIITFLLGCVYIVSLRIQPNADQRVCLDIAKQMHYGNFKEFEQDGYMQAYPQQVGLVLFYYFIGFIIGYRNVLVLQIINVAAYTAFIYCLYKIAMHLWHDEKIARWTCILTNCFIPLIMLTTFIYGTMIGLATSTYALLMAMKYMETRSTRSGIKCALFAAISIIFKKNYLIVVIAIFLLLSLHAFCKKHVRALLVIALMFVCYVSFGKAATFTMEKITGIPMGDGMPSIAWMTMGLQEGPRANGWYNEYSVKTYMDQNHDTEATAEVCKEDLIQQLKDFNANKLDAINFFNKKLASEWAEPTFQCFHLVHNQTKLATYTQKERTFANRIIVYVLVPYLNVLASIIFIGIALYAIFNYRKAVIWQLLPIIVFIGGFLFHTIWEAKGQYTICYFVLLFPYCVKGYAESFRAFNALLTSTKESGFTLNKKTAIHCLNAVRPICMILVIALSFKVVTLVSDVADYTVKNSNQIYYTFLESEPITYKTISGQYRIQSIDGKYYLDIKKDTDTDNYVLFLNEEERENQIVSVSNLPKTLDIYFRKDRKSLATLSTPKVGTETYKYYRNYYATVTKWSISQNDDNSFAIKTPDNFSLTRLPDNTLVFKETDKNSEAQKWEFIKISKSQNKKK